MGKNYIRSLTSIVLIAIATIGVKNKLERPEINEARASFITGKKSKYVARLLNNLQIERIEIPFNTINEFVNLSTSCTARDYLNLADSIVDRYASNQHVCRHQAMTAFEVYKKLININKRNELNRKIRLAAELGGLKEHFRGHMWLELLEEGKWIGYETTKKTPILNPEEIKKFSDEDRARRSTINASAPQYVTHPGTLDFYVLQQPNK